MMVVGQEMVVGEEPNDGSDVYADYSNQRRYYSNAKPQQVQKLQNNYLLPM